MEHAKDIVTGYDSNLARNYKPMEGFTIAGSYAQYVIDTAGTYKLDGLSCYGAVNFGHKHPRIVEAVLKTLETPEFFVREVNDGIAKPGFCHGANDGFGGLTAVSRNFKTEAAEKLARRLCEITGYNRMLPSSGGAEAVETAIKAMRRWGCDTKGIPDGTQQIIVAEDCFHGRTTTIISASCDPTAKHGYGPLTPGFLKVPFGDAEALEKLLEARAHEIAGLLLEPVQGEGGVIVPPKGYLTKCQELCKKHNVMFVLDEIQSGMGRTGKNFAYEHELKTRPDGIILAKALSGGMVPLSAFVANDYLLDAITVATHGSTYGGNPLASLIGVAAIDTLINENMAEKSAELGEQMMSELRLLNEKSILDVRGQGFWVGLQFKDEKTAKEFARLISVEEHVIVKDNRDVVRLSPPFCTTKDEVSLITKAVQRVAQRV
ncbi:MAG TPA: aminotransferase class III-fold pyridoxal phosphate-dependent enzyme [Alphaproteobacteria bacterium]|nr:aminotransferase class III-fold pyridoxal phosphate-dependent enzyme [Alphaproteobacteria bacterium]